MAVPRIDLVAEFTAVTSAFLRAGIDYAIIGGFAVAIWGAPRATTDIDLLIDESALDRAFEVAAALGYVFRAAPMTFSDGMRLRRVTKIVGDETVTLDFCLVNPNLDAIWASRQLVETEAGAVCVISRDALIAMKVGAGRPQDLGDVVRLTDQDR